MEEKVQQVKELITKYFTNDEKRLNHALTSLKFAEEISFLEKVNKKDTLIIQLASLLHDIGIKEAEAKNMSPRGKTQEEEGKVIAEKILTELNIEPAILERVVFIVQYGHTFDRINGLDFQIVWEAEMLVNIVERNLTKWPEHYPNMLRTFRTEAGKQKLKEIYGVS